jgi:hypothetical protein
VRLAPLRAGRADDGLRWPGPHRVLLGRLDPSGSYHQGREHPPTSPARRVGLDNFSPHLSTKKDGRVEAWATANNVELAYVPTNASYLNRIECHFTALRYFALNGTDHRNHEEQNSMIRRYIAGRNRHSDNEELRAISLRAKVA